MSNQQDTAEKSVQTHDSLTIASTVLMSNPENAATEVANTLVSMATGRQRVLTNLNDLNVISMTNNNSSSIPITSTDSYTITNGIPTGFILQNSNKLSVHHQEEFNRTSDDNDMSTDEYHSVSIPANETHKTRRAKANKTQSSKKGQKLVPAEPIQYGPLLVKPRKRVAPTLASGRRSKDDPLPPEEESKRQQRRNRNKEAAAKCRRKRNELREKLEKDEQTLREMEKNLELSVQSLSDQKSRLENLLHRHPCTKRISFASTSNNAHHLIKTDIKTIPTTGTLLDPLNNPMNAKRVTINFANQQDLLAVAPGSRVTSVNEVQMSTSPMITIHILPEVAQALLNSTSVDRTKLVELLQQASANNQSQSSTVMMNNISAETSVSNNSVMNSNS